MNSHAFLIRVSRFLLSNRLRGGTRLTRKLAERYPALQSYEVKVSGGTLFVDLRNYGTHHFLIEEPGKNDEHVVMQRVVRPNETVYDIGANAGLFTVWLSNLIGPRGRVFSFEPNPAHRPCLEKTTSGLENTVLFPVGLSDREGLFEFFVPEDDTKASLRDWTHGDGGQVSRTTCQVTTIDALTAAGEIPSPDFIKCDIEGGELDCFKGGQATLDRADAPIILFEANINSTKDYGNDLSSGLDFLARLPIPRYSFYAIADKAVLEPIDSVTFQHGNILAVPRFRMDRIEQSAIDG